MWGNHKRGGWNGPSAVYMWGVQRAVPFILQLKPQFNPPASDLVFYMLCSHESSGQKLEEKSSFVLMLLLFFHLLLHSSLVNNDALQNPYCALPPSFHPVRLFWLRNENKWRCGRAAATLRAASSIPIWMKSIRHHGVRGRRAPAAASLQSHLQIGLRLLNVFKSVDLRPFALNPVLIKAPNQRTWLNCKYRLSQVKAEKLWSFSEYVWKPPHTTLMSCH